MPYPVSVFLYLTSPQFVITPYAFTTPDFLLEHRVGSVVGIDSVLPLYLMIPNEYLERDVGFL